MLFDKIGLKVYRIPHGWNTELKQLLLAEGKQQHVSAKCKKHNILYMF